MKKIIALSIVLVVLLTCGCGSTAAPAASAPAQTAEPTPEPTPAAIEMDCAISDVLDADQQAFLASIKSNPPAVASVYLEGQYPETVVLDIDTVRNICSALSELKVSSELLEAQSAAANRLTLTRSNGDSMTVSFAGDVLTSLDCFYTLANADSFWTLLRDTCEEQKKTAEENKAAMQAEDFKTVVYEEADKSWMMRVSHTNVEPVGVSENNWQTMRTTLSLTNTGEHLIMSAKLIAKYINQDGYVVAEVPEYLDFNSAPIYLGECREYLLDQEVYNPGTDDSSEFEVILTIVNVNAPNEAGH